jgi:integrase
MERVSAVVNWAVREGSFGVSKNPLHPELERLGFVTWVTALRDAGTKQVFPEIPLQEKKTFSHTPSKWFGRYRKSGGLDGSDLDFHSFRVTFITRLLDRGVQRHLVAQVAGHEKGMITGDVYWRPDTKALFGVVQMLEIDGNVLENVSAFTGRLAGN